MITVLIVGCGIIGRHHGVVLGRHPGFQVKALTDPNREKATAVAELVEAESGNRPTVYDNLDEALRSASVDLVAICTPSGIHVEQAEEVLERGIHLVIEKPLDVSMEQGRSFARSARVAAGRGVMVSVISQHRFDPAHVAVHRAIEGEGLGRICSAVASMAWYRSQEYYDQGDWRGTWALDGGGAVMNQGVHTVDLLCWFLGRPVEIVAHTARLAHQRIEIEDTATATVRFESGALAVIHATTAAFPGLTVRIGVYGSAGSAVVDDDRLEYFFASPDAARLGTHGFSPPRGAVVENQADQLVPAEHLRSSPPLDDGFVQGHLRQYDDIAQAIRDHRPPAVGVGDALHSLALVRALYVSATLGRSVSFDDVLSGQYDTVSARVGPASHSVGNGQPGGPR